MSKFNGTKDEFGSRALHELNRDFPPQPPTIERQMLLATFAGCALTGYLAHGPADATVEEIAHDCFRLSEAMLNRFESLIKR